jgi:hypothetical protein
MYTDKRVSDGVEYFIFVCSKCNSFNGTPTQVKEEFYTLNKYQEHHLECHEKVRNESLTVSEIIEVEFNKVFLNGTDVTKRLTKF